jgi:hypothetical protein
MAEWEQNLLLQCFLIAQRVSGETPPIIRSSKTVIAASGFTYVSWLPAAAMAEWEQNLLLQCFLIAQRVSGETPPIIRSSKAAIAASGFTYACGCRPLRRYNYSF